MHLNFDNATTCSTATTARILASGVRTFLIASILTFAVLPLMSSPVPAMDGYDTERVNDAIRLCDTGHFPEAIRILTAVNQRNPKDAFVLCQLGHAHMNNAADLTHSTAIAEKCFR